MRKLLNNPWFAAVAAFVALVVVGSAFWPSKAHSSIGAASLAAEEVSEGSTAVNDGTTLSIAAILNSLVIASPLRDPFATQAVAEVPSPVEKVAAPDLVDSVHLSAVWIQSGNNLALINGRIVAAGEEIGRLKIESASSEGVWLTSWKGRNFVSVGGDFSLSTPASQPPTSTSSL